MPDVVVGVDGSPHSLEALKVATQEARCRSSRLRVVYVFEPAISRLTDDVASAGMSARPARAAESTTPKQLYRRAIAHAEEAQRLAEQQLDEFLAQADEQLRGLPVERRAVSGEHPSSALVKASKDADLLVIGSRGLGGFMGLLLGSVSQQCVQHAACPVLVVR